MNIEKDDYENSKKAKDGKSAEQKFMNWVLLNKVSQFGLVNYYIDVRHKSEFRKKGIDYILQTDEDHGVQEDCRLYVDVKNDSYLENSGNFLIELYQFEDFNEATQTFKTIKPGWFFYSDADFYAFLSVKDNWWIVSKNVMIYIHNKYLENKMFGGRLVMNKDRFENKTMLCLLVPEIEVKPYIEIIPHTIDNDMKLFSTYMGEEHCGNCDYKDECKYRWFLTDKNSFPVCSNFVG
jgi:hypothetical protein